MDNTTAQKLSHLKAIIIQEEGDKQQGRPFNKPKSDYEIQYLIVDAGQQIQSRDDKSLHFPTPEESGHILIPSPTFSFFSSATILE